MEKQLCENPLNTTSSDMVSNCSDSIPVDLLIDIFSRVPAKSIARFRFVSKLWAYVLRRPDFTEPFLSKSRTHPRLLFSSKVNGTLLFYSSPQPQNLDHDEECCVVATNSYHHKYLLEYFESGECTSVCGLALLKGEFADIRRICNPATGEFLTLPRIKGKDLSFYFGYDPINKQYKVLCTISDLMFSSRINTYHVLRLETGKPSSSWKRIESKFDLRRCCMIHYGEICINGVLYFGATLHGINDVIVSFDVRYEKFGLIQADEVRKEIMSRWGYYGAALINLKGKLGIVGMRHRELVLCVLEIDAGNHKWSTNVHALSDSEDDMVRVKRFCGMSRNGELVWSSDEYASETFHLLFYNLEGQRFTIVNVKGSQEFECGRIALHSLDYAEDVNIKEDENRHQLPKQEKSVSKSSSFSELGLWTKKKKELGRKYYEQLVVSRDSLPVSTSNKFDILSLGN